MAKDIDAMLLQGEIGEVFHRERACRTYFPSLHAFVSTKVQGKRGKQQQWRITGKAVRTTAQLVVQETPLSPSLGPKSRELGLDGYPRDMKHQQFPVGQQ